MKTEYSAEFYDSVTLRAEKSAEIISDFILRNIEIATVQDIGCGDGVWLLEFSKKIKGGSFLAVDRNEGTFSALDSADERLTIHPTDLARGVPVNEEIFDLSICLEVLEHLPYEAALNVMDYLKNTSRILLFSAATPGQGGTNHMNENPAEFWHSELYSRGFRQLDVIRPILKNSNAVPDYYKRNSFLYLNSHTKDFSHLQINWLDLVNELSIPARDIRPRRTKVIHLLTSYVPTPIVTMVSNYMSKNAVKK
jgi:SAM-dependent methyltransferase